MGVLNNNILRRNAARYWPYGPKVLCLKATSRSSL